MITYVVTPPNSSRKPASIANPDRCHFTRSDDRRCQMSRTAKHPTLCLAHAKEEQEFAQSRQDVSQELASLSGELKTASDVNHVLRKLFSLLAQRRISRRDAVAFAYIAQLILQTLPGVKREIQFGLGDRAWRETLEAALCVSEEDEDEGETDAEAGEADETETNRERDEDECEKQEPASLAELAAAILTRHAQTQGGPPPR